MVSLWDLCPYYLGVDAKRSDRLQLAENSSLVLLEASVKCPA